MWRARGIFFFFCYLTVRLEITFLSTYAGFVADEIRRRDGGGEGKREGGRGGRGREARGLLLTEAGPGFGAICRYLDCA